ncbi:TPA: hypothetical protein ACSP17_003032 [Aeromonas hydrophila]|uniref:hypothetical protein n=1 Tax=Aeromonas dhakensis TaxID=196024 RepID=UPI003B9E9F6B
MFEQFIDLLNNVLKTHKSYEPWMKFKAVKSLAPGHFEADMSEPTPGQTELSKEQIQQVYNDAWDVALPGSTAAADKYAAFTDGQQR